MSSELSFTILFHNDPSLACPIPPFPFLCDIHQVNLRRELNLVATLHPAQVLSIPWRGEPGGGLDSPVFSSHLYSIRMTSRNPGVILCHPLSIPLPISQSSPGSLLISSLHLHVHLSACVPQLAKATSCPGLWIQAFQLPRTLPFPLSHLPPPLHLSLSTPSPLLCLETCFRVCVKKTKLQTPYLFFHIPLQLLSCFSHLCCFSFCPPYSPPWCGYRHHPPFPKTMFVNASCLAISCLELAPLFCALRLYLTRLSAPCMTQSFLWSS